MSSLLTTLLEHTQPEYWEDADYSNARYKSFTLSTFSSEYKQIQAEFMNEFGSSYHITKIARIQHAYAYASCQIRRKQLSIINGGGIPEEKRICFVLKKVGQVNEFLEYNCDKRKAFGVWQKAEMACYETIPSSFCVVMAKEIQGHSYSTRSSNGYPDYLIKCNPREDVDDIGRSFGKLQLH